ncbi:MAG TPA: DUF1573 domain-containing protein [Candidatus Saccharimonadales bacterium]|nr:DUF1573 domain-containing protein [Candidatus Saccharimonadales bacterium]
MNPIIGRKVWCLTLGLAGFLPAVGLFGQELAPTPTPAPAPAPRRVPPLPPFRSSPSQSTSTTPSPAPVPAQRVAVPAPFAPIPLISPAVPPAPLSPSIVALPVAGVSPEQAAANPGAIQWDAEVKELKPSAGEATARFTFWLTNVSSSEVLVNSVRTSCGCTVAQLPSQPWHIPAGEHGPIEVTVNLAGKSGMIAKGVTVDTSVGVKQLTVKVDIPPGAGIAGAPPAAFSGSMNDSDRTKNMQLALADRQVVFKNAECAKCHADPAKGQSEGRLLYTAVCATCHNSHLRAALVPDLRALKHPTDADFWRQWITYGRAGSMMPAFAAAEGGPLSPKQIDALVEFMVKAFPNRAPQPAQAVPPAPHPAAQIPSAAGAPLLRTTASTRSP